ncbi:unnamed protein product, partial [Porites evermanni]
IITDPQIAVKFMAKQHKYERLKDFRLGSVFRQLFGHAAGTASGEAHKRIRSAFDPCYSTESVAQAVDMMEQECKHHLIHMVQDKQKRIHYFRTIRQLSTHRKKRNVSKRKRKEFTTSLQLSLCHCAYFVFVVKILISSFLLSFLELSFEERFAEGKLRDTSCVFYKLQQTRAKNPGALSEDEFQQTLEEASLANVDITCGAVAWLLFHVALHKDVQKNLTVEVKNSISSGLSGPLSLETLTKLDFLGKVVKESARKRPVMVISTPEYVTCPMVIGNFQSPPGVEVSVDNSAVNSNAGVWGDTETFNPRRFDDETPNMRKSLCRFGIGTRRCMGYRVADTFMKVLLVTLLENYSVALETDVTGDDDSVPVQKVGPFCFPCVDFKVQVVQKNVAS